MMYLNKWILPILLLLLTFSAEARRYKIVGYVSGETYLKEDKTLAEKFTHLNYTFLKVIDGRIQATSQDSLNLLTLLSLKQYNANLKVLISIGGPQGSAGYSTAVHTEEGREILATSIMQYIAQHHLDGIELHWLMSAGGQYENVFNRNDQQNYILLMALLRKKLDQQTAVENRSKKNAYLLTLSGSAQRNYAVSSGLNKGHVYLNYINVHTYDYVSTIANISGIVKEPNITGHHGNLYTSKQDNMFKFCVDNTINEYLDIKIPSRKLVMGIAFYGKGWSDAYDEEHGLYQKAEASIGSHLSYLDIQTQYLSSEKYTRYWDENAFAHYLYDPETGNFITYESQKSIRKKSNYIRNRKLGGAACMEYGLDNGQLLKKVNKGLRGPALALFRKKTYQPKNPNINKRVQRKRMKEYNAS